MKKTQLMLTLLLTAAMLLAGFGSAQAIPYKRVTYTITSIEHNTSYNQLEVTFTRTGDTPFSEQSSSYKITVPISSLNGGGSGSYSLMLADGFGLTIYWTKNDSVQFTNNSFTITNSGGSISYSLNWFNSPYYVTHIKMTDAAGTQIMRSSHPAQDINLDLLDVFQGHLDFSSYNPFGSITIDYTDSPQITSFTAIDEVNHIYQIATPQDLKRLSDYVNGSYNTSAGKTFRQTANISFDGYDTNFTPIGRNDDTNSGNESFKGTYDGQGYYISGVRVKSDTGIAIGLFGRVQDGGTIQNVVLGNSTFTGKYSIGGIVGYLINSTVRNCRVEQNVEVLAGSDNSENIGGIVGRMYNGTVIGCTSLAWLGINGKTGCQAYGGIAGQNNNGTIQNCFSDLYRYPTDNVTYAGRIVGLNYSGSQLINNYYHSTFGRGVGISDSAVGQDASGARYAQTVSLGSNIAIEGTETTYNVSRITTIGSVAMRYGNNNILYSGATQQLTLQYTGLFPDGSTLAYTVKQGDTDITSQVLSGHTLTMPDNNISITATVTTQAWEGEGTQQNPYKIAYPSQLVKLANEVNAGTDYSGKYFEQTADLVFDGTANNYTPIGGDEKYFKGHYDGKGLTISGINAQGKWYVGLFGLIGSNAVVENVILSNSSFVGNTKYVGGITGNSYNKACTIRNCHVMSSVTISAGANGTNIYGFGGIAGGNSGTIEGCTCAATLKDNNYTGTKQYGGIAGYVDNGTIKDCLFTGSIETSSGTQNIGSIVGAEANQVPKYYNCCYTGDIKGVNGDDLSSEETNRITHRVFTVSAAQGLSLATAGNGTTYNADYGIVAFSNYLFYNGCFYAPSLANVSLNIINNIPSYDIAAYQVDYGTLDVTANPYKLTMPDQKNVTVSAVIAPKGEITVTGGRYKGRYWATFYHSTGRYTLPADASAFTMNSDYKLYRLGTDGKTIPANTAVVIISDSPSTTLTVSDGTSSVTINGGGNILQGTEDRIDADSITGGKVHVMSIEHNVLGFYEYMNSNVHYIPANRAYIVK